MSGHSHWAGIKHKKAAIDKKRGKIFSKCAKKIMVAARHGGGDPDANLSLRYAIDEARESNMPRDSIDRAVKKGSGGAGDVEFYEVLYEGFGPGGTGFLVHVLTDNRNRTAGEIRKAFEKRGGNLAASGAVAHMFERKGLLAVPRSTIDEEALMMAVLDAGAEDLEASEDAYQITTDPAAFEAVKKALANLEVEPEVSEISMIPQVDVPLGEDIQRRAGALYDDLDDLDDVQTIYVNFELPT